MSTYSAGSEEDCQRTLDLAVAEFDLRATLTLGPLEFEDLLPADLYWVWKKHPSYFSVADMREALRTYYTVSRADRLLNCVAALPSAHSSVWRPALVEALTGRDSPEYFLGRLSYALSNTSVFDYVDPPQRGVAAYARFFQRHYCMSFIDHAGILPADVVYLAIFCALNSSEHSRVEKRLREHMHASIPVICAPDESIETRYARIGHPFAPFDLRDMRAQRDNASRCYRFAQNRGLTGLELLAAYTGHPR